MQTMNVDDLTTSKRVVDIKAPNQCKLSAKLGSCFSTVVN